MRNSECSRKLQIVTSRVTSNVSHANFALAVVCLHYVSRMYIKRGFRRETHWEPSSSALIKAVGSLKKREHSSVDVSWFEMLDSEFLIQACKSLQLEWFPSTSEFEGWNANFVVKRVHTPLPKNLPNTQPNTFFLSLRSERLFERATGAMRICAPL